MTISTYAPRNEAVTATWVKYPDRLVTCSTGVVHVAVNGSFTLCGTKVAVRVAASGVTPTCRNCGAEAV